MKPKKLTAADAKRRLEEHGIDFNGSFHALPPADVQYVFDVSQQAGYVRIGYAPGSVARMFFAELAKQNS